uniref:Telomerase reverse transcriptase n=1 Tax=Plectus sambesii TaxID=2011161 RepID=A0A914X6G4_9BILA
MQTDAIIAESQAKKRTRRNRRKRNRKKNEPVVAGEKGERTCEQLPLPCFIDICYDRALYVRWPCAAPYDWLKPGGNVQASLSSVIGDVHWSRLHAHPSGRLLFSAMTTLCTNRQRCRLWILLKRFVLQSAAAESAVDLAVLAHCFVAEAPFRSFVRALASALLPDNLLGLHNRERFADSCASNLYHLNRREAVHWRRFYSGFKVTSCPWIALIPDSNLQFACFTRLLKWCLSWFAAIIRRCFYITEGQMHGHRLLFFAKTTWRRIVVLASIQLRQRCQLELIRSRSTPSALIVPNQVRFVPKANGVRALVVSERTVKFRLDPVKTILAFLIGHDPSVLGAGLRNQLSSMHYDWLSAAARTSGRSKFVVKLDVAACFDMINLNILKTIVSHLLPFGRDFVVCSAWVEVKSPSGATLGKFRKSAAGYDSQSASNNFKLSARQTFISQKSFSRFTSVTIRTLVISSIEKNYMRLMGKLYLQKRGIRQGSPISVLLCTLYLGAMERKHFADILADPDSTLLRYVDDYLLFAAKLLTGIEEYSMSASPSKTVVNFASDALARWHKDIHVAGVNEPIAWCGFAVHCDRNLRLSIDSTRVEGTTARDYLVVKEVDRGKKCLHILSMVQRAVAAKVPPVVLDRRLHSISSDRRTRRAVAKFATDRYLMPLVHAVGLDLRRKSNLKFIRLVRRWLSRRQRFTHFFRLQRLFCRT